MSDTEFGKYVFSKNLTTFEALSELDVVQLQAQTTANKVLIEQTRSELNDVSRSLDLLTARVNTLQANLQSVETTAQAAASSATLATTLANDASRVARNAESIATAASTSATSASAAASKAETLALDAGRAAAVATTTADRAASDAKDALSQVSALTTPIQWRLPILMAATASRCIVVTADDTTVQYGVLLDVPSGSYAQTSVVYSGRVIGYNTDGRWATTGSRLGSYDRIIFISKDRYNPATTPQPAGGAGYIRPGIYTWRFGTSSAYSTTIEVRVVDIINNPL